MKKTMSNLMMISKLIIVTENLLEEDIDLDFFKDKIIYDIMFINNKLNELWISYKYLEIEDLKNNFLKTNYYVLKRFYKILKKIKEIDMLYNMFIESNKDINLLSEEIYNKIYHSSMQNKRLKNQSSEKQFINEDEYTLLFKEEQ